jgi:hypothetical protein
MSIKLTDIGWWIFAAVTVAQVFASAHHIIAHL